MEGRLVNFLPQWEKMTSNDFVLNIIKREYALEFHSDPPSKFLVTKLPRHSEKAKALLIGEMVDQEVLTPVSIQEQGGWFLLVHFCGKKAIWKVQTNHEPLNLSIRYKNIWMESIYSIRNLLQKEVFMATMDLREAYLHILIRKEC